MQTVLGIILGGGAGSRLYPLTKKRAKPAVPLGANYRLIDIPVSNCINSNVNKIYCLTQFNSASLNRHLSQAYVSFLSKLLLVQKSNAPFWQYPIPCIQQPEVLPRARLSQLIPADAAAAAYHSHHTTLPSLALQTANSRETPFYAAELKRRRLQLKGFCRGVGRKPEPCRLSLVPGHCRCSAPVLVAV